MILFQKRPFLRRLNALLDVQAIKPKEEFTAGKLRGYKLVINTVDKNGFKFRTIQYAFSGKSDTKMVFTATAAQADKTESDKIFDEIISSLKIEK